MTTQRRGFLSWFIRLRFQFQLQRGATEEWFAVEDRKVKAKKVKSAGRRQIYGREGGKAYFYNIKTDLRGPISAYNVHSCVRADFERALDLGGALEHLERWLLSNVCVCARQMIHSRAEPSLLWSSVCLQMVWKIKHSFYFKLFICKSYFGIK